MRVGVADAGREIIGDVSRHNPRVDLDGTACAAHNYTIAALDPFALGERRADFDERVRHETDEPWHVAAHGAGLPVLGYSVRCRDDRESIGFAVTIEFGGLPDLRTRIRLSI